MKRIPTLGWLAVLLLAGCSRGAELTQVATQTLEPPLNITYCDINPSDMCLEGFSLDIDERLLILFKADDRFFADIYVRADGPDGEILFECQQSNNFLENVYCLGDSYPEGELIKLNIYANSNDRLIAMGVFDVQYNNLPERDVTFGVEVTPTPVLVPPATTAPTSVPSYPNPSYPNSAYPNPTSTP